MSLVRSVKNTFVPINRIPHDVLSLIPDYWADEDTADDDLITLTHVCHGWRELFISRPSLWARLDCKNVEKTRTYIERSQSSPLKVYLWNEAGCIPFLYDAFFLTVPHFGRLGSLSFLGVSEDLIELAKKHFYRPAPSLEKLKIHIGDPCSIEPTIFDGNLSTLRELRLSGVITSLPWKNLANLTKFDFQDVPSDKISTTQLPDSFERAPLLRKIRLYHTLPTTSNAPPGRVVSLPHLEDLEIEAQPVHSILLKHLLIPSGTSLVLEFNFNGERSPIPDYLPKTLDNLNNLSRTTAINLSYESGLHLRLSGPSGGLYVLGHWTGADTFLSTVNRRVLRSLNHFTISTTERLTITAFGATIPQKTEKSPVYHTLLLMKSLRILILTDCLNIPFISALNPDKTPSKTLVCPVLEELVLYVKKKEWFCIDKLLGMAKGRSSSGARLSTITIVSTQEFMPVENVLELRNHVSRVEYRLDNVMPLWDKIGHEDDQGCEGGWGYESGW